jgi:hypothetical protein
MVVKPVGSVYAKPMCGATVACVFTSSCGEILVGDDRVSRARRQDQLIGDGSLVDDRMGVPSYSDVALDSLSSS